MPPPSNQSYSQRRRRDQDLGSGLEQIESRVNTLKAKIEEAKEAKRRKILLDQEQELLQQLEELKNQ
jgi:hypothetical protein